MTWPSRRQTNPGQLAVFFFVNHIYIFLPIGLFLFICTAAAVRARDQRTSGKKRKTDSIKTRFLDV